MCTETIYEAIYWGLVIPVDRQDMRTGVLIATVAAVAAEAVMVRSAVHE